jgi:hypothetical protein
LNKKKVIEKKKMYEKGLLLYTAILMRLVMDGGFLIVEKTKKSGALLCNKKMSSAFACDKEIGERRIEIAKENGKDGEND